MPGTATGPHPAEVTLDPPDWEEFRRQASRAVDTMVDYLRTVRERPVWQRVPADVEERLREGAPELPQGFDAVFDAFCRDILPYPVGNLHPRFWSWVSGSGSAVGMVADLLAAGLNTYNLGIDNTAAVRVELQVVDWLKALIGFPAEASGLLVSGGSVANLVGLAVGRVARAGYDVRARGMHPAGEPHLTVYASTEAHSSVRKAVELLGIGSAQLRAVPVTAEYEIDLEALDRLLREDAEAGHRPALLIGNAGTVNTGAIDPLGLLADIAQEHSLWLHVDGAFGAATAMMEQPPANLAGLSRADSLAFDLHKWLHQPYSAGVVLVRDAEAHRAAFAIASPYLDTFDDGVAAGPVHFGDLGLQLSRSFAALRIWLTFKSYGVATFRRLVGQNIEQARYLDALIRGRPPLELVAPTTLNIVNYRFNPGGLEESALAELNKRILVGLQCDGVAAPSSTRLNGQFAIRVCITNHRTRREDLDLLVDATLRGARRLGDRDGQN